MYDRSRQPAPSGWSLMPRVYHYVRTSMGTYAKAICAVLTAALIAAQTAIADGRITSSDWITIALAALGALAVYFVPNATPPAQPEPGKHELKENP